MGTFNPLQRKNQFTSIPAVPTYPSLRPSRTLASRPTPASEQAHPATQAQLDHAARFGHSFGQVSLFPPEKKNNTGLPDTLKAGVETLSGMPMDDVNVYYNSPKPSQMQALAYTQGTDIHVAPGQEKHLAHEAWHVIQQKQGRVKPTLQAKRVTMNDDETLEKEASVMGERANQVDNGNLQRKEAIDAGLFEKELRHPPELIQQYRGNAGSPSIMQFVKRTPTYLGSKQATHVDFDLNAKDTLDYGSPPSVKTDGWDELQTLGLTAGGKDNWHAWLLFHVLNEKAGGSGKEAGNLTPTTQQVNHHKDWNKFEKWVKTYISDENPVVAEHVNFKADVGYHGAGQVYWKKADGSTVETESSHYPNSVAARLEVRDKTLFPTAPYTWVTKASLNTTHGLIQPQDLKSVDGWKAYSDNTYKNEIKGDKGK
jgi:hypothetical protein